MLESIRIEGNILDWEGPVEINFADEPIILTGRNGAGKSLIGKIIELSIGSLKGDRKASKARDRLCKEHGVERIVLKLKRPFYEQWCNELPTNLPFFIIHNLHWELGGNYPEGIKEAMDIEFHAEHQMTYTWDSQARYTKNKFQHKLVALGYCIGFDEVNCNLSGEIDLTDLRSGPGNSKYMVHDMVVGLHQFLQKQNMSVIPLDDEIKLLTTEESEDEDTPDFEFIEYKSESEMRALLRAFNADQKYHTEMNPEGAFVWQLMHKKPIFYSSSISSEYVPISSEEAYPNYFKDLNLKFIEVNRKYTGKITKQKASKNIIDYEELLGSLNIPPPLPIEDDLDLVNKKFGITLDRRKSDLLNSKIKTRDLTRIYDFFFPGTEENIDFEYDIDHDDIHSSMDTMEKALIQNSMDPKSEEFSYVLHNHLWKRLDSMGEIEQIIAKIKFGIEIENLGSKLPSGIENLLCLLHEALLAKEGTILFIDEPEISLHIDWQAKIVDAMWKLGKRNHIIFTTHSPEIVMTNLEKVITIPPEAL